MSDVLLFVEDPGAANFVVGLPDALATRGLTCDLVVAGPAVSYLNVYDLAADGIEVDDLLDRIDPAVVVVGTAEDPDTLALPLIAAARGRGVPSMAVIDGPDGALHRFRGRGNEPFAYAPDWLLVADAWTKEQYVELGFGAHQVLATGHPNHDRVRAAARAGGLAPPSWAAENDGNAPVVVFAAERSTGLDPARFRRSDDYKLHGRGHATGRTEIVIEEFLDAVASVPVDVYTVLRLHPKNELDEFAEYFREFDHVSQTQPAIEVLAAADGLVGMATILLEEAVLLGLPTLSIMPMPDQQDMNTSVRLGLTPSVSTRAEVRAAIAALIEAPRPADPAAVEAAFPSGGSKRVAAAIEAVARGRAPS